MIQLILDSADKVIPEWENDQERLIFRLASVRVTPASLLHGRLDEAGMPAPAEEAIGMVTLVYDGSAARQVRVILELPAGQWDKLADRADELLDAQA